MAMRCVTFFIIWGCGVDLCTWFLLFHPSSFLFYFDRGECLRAMERSGIVYVSSSWSCSGDMDLDLDLDLELYM